MSHTIHSRGKDCVDEGINSLKESLVTALAHLWVPILGLILPPGVGGIDNYDGSQQLTDTYRQTSTGQLTFLSHQISNAQLPSHSLKALVRVFLSSSS